jgi:hypothetical protein
MRYQVILSRFAVGHLPGQPWEYVTCPGVSASALHVAWPTSMPAALRPVIRLRACNLQALRLILCLNAKRECRGADGRQVSLRGHIQP